MFQSGTIFPKQEQIINTHFRKKCQREWFDLFFSTTQPTCRTCTIATLHSRDLLSDKLHIQQGTNTLQWEIHGYKKTNFSLRLQCSLKAMKHNLYFRLRYLAKRPSRILWSITR